MDGNKAEALATKREAGTLCVTWLSIDLDPFQLDFGFKSLCLRIECWFRIDEKALFLFLFLFVLIPTIRFLLSSVRPGECQSERMLQAVSP